MGEADASLSSSQGGWDAFFTHPAVLSRPMTAQAELTKQPDGSPLLSPWSQAEGGAPAATFDSCELEAAQRGEAPRGNPRWSGMERGAL